MTDEEKYKVDLLVRAAYTEGVVDGRFCDDVTAYQVWVQSESRDKLKDLIK